MAHDKLGTKVKRTYFGKRLNLGARDTALAEQRAKMRERFDYLNTLAKRGKPAIKGEAERWLFLGAEMGWSPFTIAHWVRVGAMPRDKAKLLEYRFGRTLVEHEKFCGDAPWVS